MQTGKMYKNVKNKVETGGAFSTCLSANDTVCHFSPLASDESVLEEGDIASRSGGWKHDVFLNFRGAETRYNFTSYLHHALCRKGIRTFIDSRLERGKEVSLALLEEIEGSRISLLVFSKDYASSTYCLEELVKILECHESKGQIVVPIFYSMSADEVNQQTGSFGEAFARHEEAAQSMEGKEKVRIWRAALSKASSFSGWYLNNRNEADFVQCIAEEVFSKVNSKVLHVAEYPVGLDSHIEDMNDTLSIGSNDVRMVGICGTGGIGKTTIAKAIFNKFANQFEGSSFLLNVRENSKKRGVSQLQETVLFQTLGEKIVLMENFDLGINVLRSRLCNKRVLIVIDDVDDIEQLKKLAGSQNWFGVGSRIIITTRDEHLLTSHGVRIVHKVKELCPEDALQLFSWNAFKKPQPEENYAELSHCVVKYASGLPQALTVLGSDLFGRSVSEWESELDKLKQTPKTKILGFLKISFEGCSQQPSAQWQLHNIQQGSIEIPPVTVSSLRAQLIHQESFNDSNSSSKKRVLDLREDQDSSIPERSIKRKTNQIWTSQVSVSLENLLQDPLDDGYEDPGSSIKNMVVSALKMYSYGGPIWVRATRVWISTNNGQPTSFNCVFMDAEGGAIQALARTKDVRHFSSQIEEGGFYEISNFYTYENKFKNVVVDNEAVIDLKQDVRIQPLQTNSLPIQRYLFFLMDYCNLLTKGQESQTLIDVLGRIKAMQPLQMTTVRGSCVECKREIIIDNIRNEELRITLWGDVARRFDAEFVCMLKPPFIAVFAGFRVCEFLGRPVLSGTAASAWYFNPDIPELLSYKTHFGSIPSKIEQLAAPAGSRGSIEHQTKENRKSIRELLCMNPHDFKRQRFTCRASITNFNVHWGWWYRSCPICNRLLRQEGSRLRCQTHDYINQAPVPWFKVDCIVTDGVDLTNFILMGKPAENFFGNSARYYVVDKGFNDHKIPPPMIEKLMKYRIFQVQFGMVKSSNNRCNILVNNVFDNDSDDQT